MMKLSLQSRNCLFWTIFGLMVSMPFAAQAEQDTETVQVMFGGTVLMWGKTTEVGTSSIPEETLPYMGEDMDMTLEQGVCRVIDQGKSQEKSGHPSLFSIQRHVLTLTRAPCVHSQQASKAPMPVIITCHRPRNWSPGNRCARSGINNLPQGNVGVRQLTKVEYATAE